MLNLAIDKDPDAIKAIPEEVKKDARFVGKQGAFKHIAKYAKECDFFGNTDGILLDLGVSSPQLDDAIRGFSFLQDGPLDMRMDSSTGLDAATWINAASAAEIAEVLKTFGEERYAKRIASAIAQESKREPILTTGRLAEIVKKANPAWEKTKHPATRSFQAMRLFINDELNELQVCLKQSLEVLKVGGRLAMISFHSLEDRIAKRFFREQERGLVSPAEIPITQAMQQQRLQRIGKAIKPTDAEVAANPRARSAVLRVAEKVL